MVGWYGTTRASLTPDISAWGGRGRGGLRGGKWGGGLRRQWGRSNAAVMSDACTPNHRLQPPQGPPIPSRNMGRNGSPQQTENAIEWRILPEGRVLFASNPEKDNAQKSFCYLHISLCRKKIMLRAPSCSTWNCDADSSSGNCLAAWQDWQNPRRERIHLIRLPLISSSAFLITWKYAFKISTTSQILYMLLWYQYYWECASQCRRQTWRNRNKIQGVFLTGTPLKS